jgi:tRNA A-37 threonylcarbamoyl transferase component Bud32
MACHCSIRRNQDKFQIYVAPKATVLQGNERFPDSVWLNININRKLYLTPAMNVFLQIVMEKQIRQDNTFSEEILEEEDPLSKIELNMIGESYSTTFSDHMADFIMSSESNTFTSLTQTSEPTQMEEIPSNVPAPPTNNNSQTNQDLKIGNIILNRYEIVEILGKGGMGIVYKVNDMALKRHVALKMLLAQQAQSTEASERFFHEARSMAKLHHKNIVRIQDIGEYKGMPYFTMDLVEGQELTEYAGKAKPREVMDWAYKLCQAIQYIHDKGIIHRDLKPSNIIISNNEPVLMDFGIARDESVKSNLTADGQSIGTPVYMSPEQALGRVKEINAKTDIYGIGAILYEILTGQPPFSGNPMQVMYKVCSTNPVPMVEYVPTMPKDISMIVEKAMSKAQSSRYQNASEMAQDIKRYLDGFRVHAKAPSVLAKFNWYLRRRARATFALIGFLIVVFGMVGLHIWRIEQEKQDKQRKIADIYKDIEKTNDDLKESPSIESYFKLLKQYTSILEVDPKRSTEKKAKFDIFIEIAEYAVSIRNYQFASMMYNAAKDYAFANHIDIPKDIRAKIENECNTLEERDKMDIDNMLNDIFSKLSKN